MQRRRARIAARLWNNDEEISGFTSDISGTGVFVETQKRLEVGTRYHLELGLETGPFLLECVVARVLRAARTVQAVVKSGAGLRFVDVSEVVRELQSGPRKGGLQVDLQDPETLGVVYKQDIQRGGLRVESDQEFELEQVVRVELRLPRPYGALEVRGSVISVIADPPGAALQLLDLDQIRGKLAPLVGS